MSKKVKLIAHFRFYAVILLRNRNNFRNFAHENLYHMLAKFSVTNYMGFSKKITWDLSMPRAYNFNSHLIKDGIVKNGIIYGDNGSGKTSLGKAVFDIVSLVGSNSSTDYSSTIYQGSINTPIDFEYFFKFGEENVVYSYSKDNRGQLVKESLYSNGTCVFKKDENELFISESFPVDPAMKKQLMESTNAVSIVKFIRGSYPLTKEHCIEKLIDFVGSMLWFRCLDERNFIGIDSSWVNIEEYIIKHNYIHEFEDFLSSESKQSFDFSPTNQDHKILYCKIDGNTVPFLSVRSTGTTSLELLFYWICRMKESNIRMVFIDEFDAFYHFELSINVCNTLFREGFQVFMTSHNTMLLGNDFLRPDCGFFIRNGKIDALCDCTDRGELRQGHNIEKMYRAGAFN